RVAEVVRADPAAVRAEAADGFTALHLAAFFGQLEVAAVLLEHGAAVAAAAGGHAAIVALLLERGADPDAHQQGGFVPLHSAAARGDEVTARLLLDHGATPDVRADDGRRPLDLAPAGDGIHALLGG